jgi:Ser/Thr protein kinase RdoA (MazF antagonist)
MIRNYTVEDVTSLLHEHYGLEGKIKELGSYADRNFLLETLGSTQGSTKYIVKISLQI